MYYTMLYFLGIERLKLSSQKQR